MPNFCTVSHWSFIELLQGRYRPYFTDRKTKTPCGPTLVHVLCELFTDGPHIPQLCDSPRTLTRFRHSTPSRSGELGGSTWGMIHHPSNRRVYICEAHQAPDTSGGRQRRWVQSWGGNVGHWVESCYEVTYGAPSSWEQTSSGFFSLF